MYYSVLQYHSSTKRLISSSASCLKVASHTADGSPRSHEEVVSPGLPGEGEIPVPFYAVSRELVQARNGQQNLKTHHARDGNGALVVVAGAFRLSGILATGETNERTQRAATGKLTRWDWTRWDRTRVCGSCCARIPQIERESACCRVEGTAIGDGHLFSDTRHKQIGASNLSRYSCSRRVMRSS